MIVTNGSVIDIAVLHHYPVTAGMLEEVLAERGARVKRSGPAQIYLVSADYGGPCNGARIASELRQSNPGSTIIGLYDVLCERDEFYAIGLKDVQETARIENDFDLSRFRV